MCSGFGVAGLGWYPCSRLKETQDDAHIFCMEEQINSETVKFCDLLKCLINSFKLRALQQDTNNEKKSL